MHKMGVLNEKRCKTVLIRFLSVYSFEKNVNILSIFLLLSYTNHFFSSASQRPPNFFISFFCVKGIVRYIFACGLYGQLSKPIAIFANLSALSFPKE